MSHYHAQVGLLHSIPVSAHNATSFRHSNQGRLFSTSPQLYAMSEAEAVTKHCDVSLAEYCT